MVATAHMSSSSSPSPSFILCAVLNGITCDLLGRDRVISDLQAQAADRQASSAPRGSSEKKFGADNLRSRVHRGLVLRTCEFIVLFPLFHRSEPMTQCVAKNYCHSRAALPGLIIWPSQILNPESNTTPVPHWM
jgi:hypothetical protein